MMKQIRIKTYDEKKNGEKWYLKDSNNDLAFGFLRTSAFSETDEDCFQRCFLRNSFECEQDFDTKRLLWACMDLLIKADLTISEIKKERMKLLHRVAPSEI